MIVIFSTVVIDPARRDELLPQVEAWLERTAGDRAAASAYELLVSPSDPSRVHYFQAWPDEQTFATWSASDAHHDAVFRQEGNALDSWAVVYEGCTGTTVIRPSAPAKTANTGEVADADR